MKITLIVLVFGFLSNSVLADSFKFGVTKRFCEFHFDGDIAFVGTPYNETDVIKEELTSRRIVQEFVTSNVAYIWYEHGGRGYHQHLVQYNVLNPSEIIENYTFFDSQYKSIQEIIANKVELSVGRKEEL